jgi:hypothetical protein
MVEKLLEHFHEPCQLLMGQIQWVKYHSFYQIGYDTCSENLILDDFSLFCLYHPTIGVPDFDPYRYIAPPQTNRTVGNMQKMGPALSNYHPGNTIRHIFWNIIIYGTSKVMSWS